MQILKVVRSPTKQVGIFIFENILELHFLKELEKAPAVPAQGSVNAGQMISLQFIHKPATQIYTRPDSIVLPDGPELRPSIAI